MAPADSALAGWRRGRGRVVWKETKIALVTRHTAVLWLPGADLDDLRHCSVHGRRVLADPETRAFLPPWHILTGGLEQVASYVMVHLPHITLDGGMIDDIQAMALKLQEHRKKDMY